MNTPRLNRFASHLRAGQVYRRARLARLSPTVDRDLSQLVANQTLVKVAPGLYHKPRQSRYGPLPPEPRLLVRAFLQSDDFLLFSWNDYNALNMGLTQLHHRWLVYNHKRHGLFQLGGQWFDFRRPSTGFPKKMTAAFLVVDLLNHTNELVDEGVTQLKAKLKDQLTNDQFKEAAALAKHYGKVATKKYFGHTR